METKRQVLAGLGAGAFSALAGSALAQGAGSGGPLSDSPIVLPKSEFVYEAIFDLDPTMQLGQGPMGERRMVPITGGVFQGPKLKGKVLPGGADRQLLRKDGARILDALYELQTDDGAVITVHNKVLIDKWVDGSPYAFSHVHLTAPEGPHDWLNHRVFVGTLHSLRPKPNVLIRVFMLV